MKKLLQKYIEIYPDGKLCDVFKFLILKTSCEDEAVKATISIVNHFEIVTDDEVSNFNHLLKSYESI